MFFNTTPSVSVQEAHKSTQKQGTVFIDVRTAGEYASGHAEGARSMPLDLLGANDVAELARQDAVYVICRSGGRSAAAVEALRQAGVNAINVSGGTLAWQGEGLPMR